MLGGTWTQADCQVGTGREQVRARRAPPHKSPNPIAERCNVRVVEH